MKKEANVNIQVCFPYPENESKLGPPYLLP